MTFTEAAAEVLRLVGRPLHYKEITDLAIEKNLLSHVGKSPEVTMGARLAALLKKSAKDNPLVRVKPGVFALREWDAATIKAGMSEKTPKINGDTAGAAEDEAAPEKIPEDRTSAAAPSDEEGGDWDEEDEPVEQAPDELMRAEIAAAGAELFGEEDDDDRPILGGDDPAASGPASGEGAPGQRRRRRRRRGRGRSGAEGPFAPSGGGGLPSYTVTPAFGEGRESRPSNGEAEGFSSARAARRGGRGAGQRPSDFGRDLRWAGPRRPRGSRSRRCRRVLAQHARPQRGPGVPAAGRRDRAAPRSTERRSAAGAIADCGRHSRRQRAPGRQRAAHTLSFFRRARRAHRLAARGRACATRSRGPRRRRTLPRSEPPRPLAQAARATGPRARRARPFEPRARGHGPDPRRAPAGHARRRGAFQRRAANELRRSENGHRHPPRRSRDRPRARGRPARLAPSLRACRRGVDDDHGPGPFRGARGVRDPQRRSHLALRRHRFRPALRRQRGRRGAGPHAHRACPTSTCWKRCAPRSHGARRAATLERTGASKSDVIPGRRGGWRRSRRWSKASFSSNAARPPIVGQWTLPGGRLRGGESISRAPWSAKCSRKPACAWQREASSRWSRS